MTLSMLIVKDCFPWVTCYHTSTCNEHPCIVYKVTFKTSPLPPIFCWTWVPFHISFLVWLIVSSLMDSFPQRIIESFFLTPFPTIIKTICILFIFQSLFNPIVHIIIIDGISKMQAQTHKSVPIGNFSFTQIAKTLLLNFLL
jgi:ABC-type glucose/galactose transport system permease subunit